MKLFTKDKTFYESLVTLALPIVLQNLITFLVGFMDNLMIGTLGDLSVSGVTIGNNFQTILQMFTIGVDAGVVILATQYWGIHDRESVKRIGAMGIRYACYVGVFLTAIVAAFPRQLLMLFTPDAGILDAAEDYVRIVAYSFVFFCASQMMISTLRSVENVRIGFVVSFIALFINIGLNYVLIFGKLGLPALGIRGAAIATLIARIFEFIIVYLYAFLLERRLRMRISDLIKTNTLLRKDFFRCGLPVLLGQMVWAVNLLFYSGVMGHMDPAAVTASAVTGQFESLLRVGVFGLSSALGIITGKTVGAGEFEKMKEYARTAQMIFLFVGLLSGLFIFLLKKPFTGLYRDISPEAVSYCSQFFNVLTITFIGTCYQATCLSGLVKSGGDTGFVFKMDTIVVFAVLIPAGLLTLLLGAPAWAVYLSLKCDQVLKCIVAAVKINRYDWMKKLARNDLVHEE